MKIAMRIVERLHSNKRLGQYHIAVEFQGGTVTLSGHVASLDQIILAMQIVLAMPEVKRVVNNIEVGNETGNKPPAATPPPPLRPAGR